MFVVHLFLAFFVLASQVGAGGTNQEDTVNVKWIDGVPEYLTGATFGLP